MTLTLGLVANVFNEVNALPGWLETHLPYFDDVRVTHAGPQGKRSTDGTIELLERWGIHVDFDSIDDGFGAVRTRTIRRSPCDYVMLLDADERFYRSHHVLVCTGESTPQSEVDTVLQSYDFKEAAGKTLPIAMKAMRSNWENMDRLGAKLRVNIVGNEPYNQGQRLRDILDTYKPDAVATMRRHWHDLSFRRPTQNWHEVPDWQQRIVRNHESIYFDPNVRVHECLHGAKDVYRADPTWGPFFEHCHFFFKKMEPVQREHDVRVYNAIHEGKVPPVD